MAAETDKNTLSVHEQDPTDITSPDNEADAKTDGSKEEEEKKVVSFGELFRYADGTDKLRMVVGVLGAVCMGAAMPLFSYAFGEVNDRLATVSQDQVEDEVRDVAYAFLAIGALAFFGSWLMLHMWIAVSAHLTRRIRYHFVKAALHQDITWFETNGSGALLTQLQNDTLEFSKGTGEQVAMAFQHIVTFFGGLGLGIWRGWQLTLVIMGITPILAISAAFLTVTMGTLTERAAKAYEKAGQVAEETMSSIRTVIAFGGEQRQIDTYVATLQDAKAAGVKRGYVNGFGLGFVNLVFFSSYALCLWFGGWLIREGKENNITGDAYTPGDIAAVFFAVIIGAFELGQAGPSFEAITVARAAAYRLYQMIDRTPMVDCRSIDAIKQDEQIAIMMGKLEEMDAASVAAATSPSNQDVELVSVTPSNQKQEAQDEQKQEGSKRSSVGVPAISVKDVCFSYPKRPDVEVLSEFSVEIKQGGITALVGESGSGKSSIVQLLLRYYNASSGQIHINNQPIDNLNVYDWRDSIGYVQQKPKLFDGSILDNIKFGLNREVSQEEVEAAAKMAAAHDFISRFPDKYNAPVGEEGSLLSGGQRQRIAIARALIKRPSFLILDEGTSALDNESERRVQEAIENSDWECSILLIAHRLSTVINADQICVVDKGRVVETGTYTELMEQKGRFHQLVLTQQIQEGEGQEDEKNDQKGCDQPPSIDHRKTLQAATTGGSQKSGAKEEKHQEGKEEEDEEEDLIPMSRIMQDIRPDMCQFIIAIIGSLFVGGAMPLFGYVFPEMMDALYEEDEDEMIDQTQIYALLFFGMGLALLVGQLMLDGSLGRVGENLTMSLRKRSLTKILFQSSSWRSEKRNNSRVLLARLSGDAALVQNGTIKKLGAFGIMAATLCVGLALAFSNGWKLALVTCAILPAIVLSATVQYQYLTGFAEEGKKSFDVAARVAGEAFAEIHTVQSFCAQDAVLAKFDGYLEAPLESALKGAFSSGVGFGMGQLILFCAYALCFWYGSRLVQDDEMTFAGVLTVIFAIIMAGFGMGQASTMIPDVLAATKAKNDVYSLLDEEYDEYFKADAEDGDDGVDEKNTLKDGSIHIKDVTFAYPLNPDQNILQNLTLDIPSGVSTALCGISGGGKSTILNLLLRLFKPQEGEIRIGGLDIESMNLRSLRKQLAYVDQSVQLFDMTIHENIAYGKFDATRDEVVEAAKAANLHEFIHSLPEGYDTPLGSKGGRLSGGQRQRICLARALLRKPKILLLDEATSDLDAQSEKVVQETLESLMKTGTDLGMTIVIIAHRLSTIRNCDQICVLNQGSIAESGDHEQLMEKNALYATLVQVKSDDK